MRISDWSSDVCSSDLEGRADKAPPVPLDHIVRDLVETMSSVAQAEMALIEARGSLAWHAVKWTSAWGFIAACALLVAMLAIAFGAIMVLRSEEHTSELQSLMRISYAVFCLKKKKKKHQHTVHI